MANNHPVVLVHGLFGYGPKEMLGFSYWGQAMKVPCSLQRFEATSARSPLPMTVPANYSPRSQAPESIMAKPTHRQRGMNNTMI
ncbi:MAG: hypothetical protein ACXWTL_10625 [Methylobacter sp.]